MECTSWITSNLVTNKGVDMTVDERIELAWKQVKPAINALTPELSDGYNEHEVYMAAQSAIDAVLESDEYREINQIKDLEENDRIKVRQIPSTSGKDHWEIWKWNNDKVLWEDVTPIRIETRTIAIQEANKLKNK